MAENTKQSNKERLKDITDSIERGIEELFQSDKYAEYLKTMSRFHRHSANNSELKRKSGVISHVAFPKTNYTVLLDRPLGRTFFIFHLFSTAQDTLF